jgi:hypothetical protein
MKTENCRDCGAGIVWATNNQSQRRTMLDVRPWPPESAHGNTHLDTAHNSCVELEPEIRESAKQRGIALHTNHFETCPARERVPRYLKTFGEEEKGIYEHAN